MAMSIQRSVGKGGVNLKPDVLTVQTLLNKAGASPSLMVDGLCGPMTNDAIRKFQSSQFGPAGADGRVDPNGRTIARLNDFDQSEAPLTTLSSLMCPHGGTVRCIPTGPPRVGGGLGGTPLRTSDPGVVEGCGHPTPCTRVKWVPALTLTLNARSLGLCLNAANIPQGSVIVAKV